MPKQALHRSFKRFSPNLTRDQSSGNSMRITNNDANIDFSLFHFPFSQIHKAKTRD